MKKPKDKKLIIIIVLLLLLCGAFIFIFFQRTATRDRLTPDSDAADYDGDHQTLQLANGQAGIAVPGQPDTLVFSTQTNQAINIYNPEANNCLFLPSLYVNDVKVWQGGYLAPGKAYYTIELNKPLKPGDYSAHILYNCFREDGTALNNAKVKFNLIVKE